MVIVKIWFSLLAFSILMLFVCFSLLQIADLCFSKRESLKNFLADSMHSLFVGMIINLCIGFVGLIVTFAVLVWIE